MMVTCIWGVGWVDGWKGEWEGGIGGNPTGYQYVVSRKKGEEPCVAWLRTLRCVVGLVWQIKK